jgi:hypothetical protein
MSAETERRHALELRKLIDDFKETIADTCGQMVVLKQRAARIELALKEYEMQQCECADGGEKP